jgi:hypothetical protein
MGCTMKYFAAVLILLGLTVHASARHYRAAPPPECLHGQDAVYAAHPDAWASYRLVHGRKCWYGASRADHRTPIRAASVPAPKAAPVESPAIAPQVKHNRPSPVPAWDHKPAEAAPASTTARPADPPACIADEFGPTTIRCVDRIKSAFRDFERRGDPQTVASISATISRTIIIRVPK